MPGFNVNGFGPAGQPSNTVETRRKYRWKMTTLGRGNGSFSQSELIVLKSATRPKFKYEELKMGHNQEYAYFAGQQTYEPMSLVWYDVENPDVSKGLYNWLETVTTQTDMMVGHPSTYKKQARLEMLDGFGGTSEAWDIYGAWPMEFDWKELDYTGNEIMEISVSMRYDRAIRDCAPVAAVNATSPRC